MIRKRNIGRAATIGGLTATIALLTGLPSRRAPTSLPIYAPIRKCCSAASTSWLKARTVSRDCPAPWAPRRYPGEAMVGGSFPRSFLIPGTDTSIRVGGFVDITGLYFLKGGGNTSWQRLVQLRPEREPGRAAAQWPDRCPRPRQRKPSRRRHSRGNGVFEFSPQQSRINIETRTPTAWGEARTFFECDWSGCNNFSCQTLQQGGRRQPASAAEVRLRHFGWVPRRTGDLELLRRRCRHRIDGIRRRDGLDRRLSRSASALHPRRTLRQRLLGIGGAPTSSVFTPVGIVRRTQVPVGTLPSALAPEYRRDLQWGALYWRRHRVTEPGPVDRAQF